MYVTENVYKIEATKGAYAYAVKTQEGTVLIDTCFAGRGKKIMDELRREGLNKISKILITHHDIDHIGNAAFIQNQCNCDVYISEIDLPYVLAKKKRPGIKKILGILMKAQIPQNLKVFQGNEMGGFKLFPTPGHTPGHTCLLFDNVLFAGDMVATKDNKIGPPPEMFTVDMEQNQKSVESLHELDFQWVCPAHGEPVRSSSVRI